MNAFKIRYETELDKLNQRRLEMLTEMEDMKDVDRKKEEMNQERINLEEDRETIKAKLESTKAAVVEVQRKNNDILVSLYIDDLHLNIKTFIL